jgi:hypothetical protein
VQHLLAAPRHQRTWDIVLATVFDVLESGPKTTRELAEADLEQSSLSVVLLGLAC